jgi:hypothetical protein
MSSRHSWHIVLSCSIRSLRGRNNSIFQVSIKISTIGILLLITSYKRRQVIDLSRNRFLFRIILHFVAVIGIILRCPIYGCLSRPWLVFGILFKVISRHFSLVLSLIFSWVKWLLIIWIVVGIYWCSNSSHMRKIIIG